MPVIPNAMERFFFLSLNRAPGAILDLLGGTLFRAVNVAIDLGIFEHLQSAPGSAAKVACQIDGNEETTRRLLEFLVAGRYLRKRAGAFSNTPLTSKWLLRAAPGNVVEFLRLWNGLLFEVWRESFEMTLKRGTPEIHLHDWLSRRPERWHLFNSAMAAMAAAPAEEMAMRLKLPTTARRLLDVGGNHGLYSAAFCRRNSHLRATIFDLPEALELAGSIRGERIELQSGDVRKDSLGSGYDVVLLSNVLHYFGARDAESIIQRAAAALVPGGLLVVSEQLAGSAATGAVDAFLRLVSLNYLLVLGGDAYPLATIVSWMERAACRLNRKFGLRSAAGQTLLIARKGA
jgi:SAM-dependent methyltransferase